MFVYVYIRAINEQVTCALQAVHLWEDGRSSFPAADPWAEPDSPL